MDRRLSAVLEDLLCNIDVLNSEVDRLGRSESFPFSAKSLQLIEHIRGSCIASLQNVRTVERRIHQRITPPTRGREEGDDLFGL